MQPAQGVADGIDSDSGRRRAMRRQLRALALMVLLLEGCGGRSNPAAGFINQTHHSDAELWAMWRAAQQSLSRQIDLNPLQRTLANVPPQTLPGDPRVWNGSPRQLTVSSQGDVSSSALYAATRMSRPAPTRLRACPQPFHVR